MKNVKRNIHNFFTRNYMRSYAIFHPIEKKILFSSFLGKQYSDNPRAISEKMHEMFPEYKLVWYFDKNVSAPEYIPEYVEPIIKKGKFDFSFYKALATSFCYVTNYSLRTDIIKRNGQFFIQTWHGDIAVKKILNDVYNGKKNYLHIMDPQYTDLCIAGSNQGVKMYRNAFCYTGEVLKMGSPRNDKLIVKDEKKNKDIRKKFADEDTKILLYAPTFRDNLTDRLQSTNIDLNETISVLEEKGRKWICLIRSHVASKGLDFNYGEKFLNVTDYPDMSDLLAISDMLITDYSSCSGDMICSGKPVIFVMTDRDEYISQCREFDFELSDVTDIIAYSQEELNEIIRTKSASDYAANQKRWESYFGVNETGHSSENICKRINLFFKKQIN